MGQGLEPDRAVLACRVVEPNQWCRRCGAASEAVAAWLALGTGGNLVQHPTVARVAEGLPVAWDTANDAV